MTNRSLCDTHCARDLRAGYLLNRLELLGSKHTGTLLASQGVCLYVSILIAPSPSKVLGPASFCLSTAAVTAVTVGVPWRL